VAASTTASVLYGTPHVCWEYTWTGHTLTIRLWVPGTVPPGAAEAAVRAAWRGTTVTTTDAGPPIPDDVTAAAGGALRPQQADTIPLRADHDTDPLRALLAAGAAVRHHEHACVQILARPPPPATYARPARHADRPPISHNGAGCGPDVAVSEPHIRSSGAYSRRGGHPETDSLNAGQCLW
jgi:hypothetical protein